GPVEVVTVDANGVLGRQDTVSAAQFSSLSNVVQAVSEVSAAQFAALESDVSNINFQLEELSDQANGGIAAAMAFGGTMIVPDSNVSVSLNASTFQGEQGFAGTITARVSERIYVSGGVAGSTAANTTGGRVGIAFGF
ncbi:MAG: YadA-like family protein, partial [Erythrobacter sp.]